MDNLTHTLIGALVGDTTSRFASNASSGLPADTRRSIWMGLMMVGSNLPDADFIYPMLEKSKLSYLSEHRGHTHTVLGALVLAVLMWLVCEWWLKRRKLHVTRHDRYGLFGIALLGPLLHIVLDYTTSYGVHPFWPFDNRWFYGDSVFIIEPLLWAACAPLYFVLKSAPARAAIMLTQIAGVVLSVRTGMVPPVLCVILVVLILAMLAVGKLAQPRSALLAGIAVWLAITAGFTMVSRIAAARSVAISTEQFPDVRILDQSLTPLPVNPLCWAVIQPRLQGDEYVLRSAMLSLAPTLIPANKCPRRASGEQQTAPLTTVAAPDRADWQWIGELRMPRNQMRALAESYCEAKVLLHFARTPWAAMIDGRWVLGDLRYDREPELSFAEIELQDAATCTPVPPWLPPRNDLLGE